MHIGLGFGNVYIVLFYTFHLFSSFLLKTFREIKVYAMDLIEIAPFNLIITYHDQETSFLPSYYGSFELMLPCLATYTFEELEAWKN